MKVSLLVCLLFSFTHFTYAQDNCIQQLEDLGKPVKSDTFRIIDPHTYTETFGIMHRYIPLEVIYKSKVESVEVEDNTTNQHIASQLRMQFMDNLNEFDAIRSEGNRKIFYIYLDGCLKIYKTKEIF